MSERYTPSRLRANLYRILDRVLETGVPVEVERKGRSVLITPGEETSRLSGLRPYPGYLPDDPENIVHVDWSREWRP